MRKNCEEKYDHLPGIFQFHWNLRKGSWKFHSKRQENYLKRIKRKSHTIFTSLTITSTVFYVLQEL